MKAQGRVNQVPHKRLFSPIGWVGGKRQLAPFIISLFPEHKHYIEVFGGGLSVLFCKQRSYCETINDFDGDLINLWRAVKHYPQSLADRMNTMWHSREIFNDLNASHIPINKLERAVHTLYSIQSSFGGKRTHFGRNLQTKALNIWRDFTIISQRLKMVQIENQDFQKILQDFDKEGAFFYCDPPYYGSDTYYKASKDGFDHARLKNTLDQIKGKWLVSYNDCPEIRELYSSYTIIETPLISYTIGGNNSRGKKIREIVVINY